jgi:hypothetical protein
VRTPGELPGSATGPHALLDHVVVGHGEVANTTIEVVDLIERFAVGSGAPVRTGVEVTSVGVPAMSTT